MIDIKTYKTNNLNIASFLFASGLKFEGAIKNKLTLIFTFSPKGKAEDLVRMYFKGTANVNPRDLFARLKDLKDLIFNQT